jgi:hypothetical protein
VGGGGRAEGRGGGAGKTAAGNAGMDESGGGARVWVWWEGGMTRGGGEGVGSSKPGKVVGVLRKEGNPGV